MALDENNDDRDESNLTFIAPKSNYLTSEINL